MSTEIEVAQVTTALVEFDRVTAGLAALKEKWEPVVYDVRTKSGMTIAKEARKAYRDPRLEVERLRKAAKAPLLDLGRKLDSEATRITIELKAGEDRHDKAISDEENRLHEEAVAKATAERERVEALEARLEALQLMPFDAQGLTSAQCQACLDEARALVVGEDWQEYAEKAERAKVSVVAALEGMVAKAKASEAEAARIIAERAELEQLRAKQAAADVAERKRQTEEAKRVADAQRVEAARLAAEKAELDRIEAERAAAAKAEQDKLAAERAEFERAKEEDRQRFEAHHNRETKEQLTERLGKEPEVIFSLPPASPIQGSGYISQERFENGDIEEISKGEQIALDGFFHWFATSGYDEQHIHFAEAVWLAACAFCEDRL